MAQILLVLLAGTILSAQAVDPLAQNSAETECPASYKSSISVTASQNTQSLRTTTSEAPVACEHAISTKGTGAAGRVVPTSCEHAINTKGTGTSGRSAGGDCDDDCDGLADETAQKDAVSPKGTGSSGRTADACLAIKTKGTSAK